MTEICAQEHLRRFTWQPIETAPVNERVILWRKGRSPWTSKYFGPLHNYGYGAKPSHWMLLPPPPEVNE